MKILPDEILNESETIPREPPVVLPFGPGKIGGPRLSVGLAEDGPELRVDLARDAHRACPPGRSPDAAKDALQRLVAPWPRWTP